MPKTTMHKNCYFSAKPYKVGFARKFLTVDAIPSKTKFPAEFTYRQLRGSVFPSDSPHIL